MAAFSKPVRTGTINQRLLHLPNQVGINFDEETLVLLARFQARTKWTLFDWQRQGVDSLRKGHDLFVKAGTGAGKSMIYLVMIEAIPDGIILVLCPLLSLMHDQIYTSN
jgi:superfamily II RNA helicase